jgi:SNF2 family DNA or RNA helicase
MGLGKTLQMIAFLEAQKKHFTIVVCPSSLILNWKDEFEKFSSRLKVVCVMGSIPVRKDIIGQAKDYDVLITSYDYMRRDVELYSKYKFDYIITNEGELEYTYMRDVKGYKKIYEKDKLKLYERLP